MEGSPAEVSLASHWRPDTRSNWQFRTSGIVAGGVSVTLTKDLVDILKRARLVLNVGQNGSHLLFASNVDRLLLQGVNLVAEGGELRGSLEEVSVGVDGQGIREVSVPGCLGEECLNALHVVHASIVLTFTWLGPGGTDSSFSCIVQAIGNAV